MAKGTIDYIFVAIWVLDEYMSKKNSIIIVACPDRDAANEPDAFGG